MADPVEIILDFLQRHKFQKAESAFKAELLSRNRGEKPLLCSENVVDWDSQLCSPVLQDMVSFAEEHDRRIASPKQTVISTPEMDVSGHGTGITLRIRSPPLKQLFVEYESGELNSQDIMEMASQGFAMEAFRTLSESEAIVLRGPVPPLRESEGLGSSHVDLSQHMEGFLPGRPGYLVQPLPLEKHTQWRQCEQASAQYNGQSYWHQPPNCTGSSDQGRYLLGAEVQRSFESITLSKDVKPEPDDPGTEGPSSGLRADKEQGKGEVKNGGTRALQLKDGFLPSTCKGSSFKDPAVKTVLPLSFFKPFGSEEQQRSLILDHSDLSGERDMGGLDWNGGELQNFEGRDSIVESRVVDHAPVAGNESFMPIGMNGSGMLSRLPPGRIQSLDKNLDSVEDAVSVAKNENSTRRFESAAFHSTASTREVNSGWGMLSDGFLSQDTPYPAAIHGSVERWYADEYCDSDTWEDDDDAGYHRQPIEDEEWFLAHEIDYPSDDEGARPSADQKTADAKQLKKFDEDERSFVEEDSYFTGEEYFRQEAAQKESELRGPGDQTQLTYSTLDSTKTESDVFTLSRGDEHGFDYDGLIFDSKELNLLSSQPVWKGFIYEGKERHRPEGQQADGVDDDEHHGSLRSGGPVLSSDAADVGSEVRDSMLGCSSDGDPESLREQELVAGKVDFDEFTRTIEGRHVKVKDAAVCHLGEQYYNEDWANMKGSGTSDDTGKLPFDLRFSGKDHGESKHSSNKAVQDNGGSIFGGFAFPSFSSTCDLGGSRAGSGTCDLGGSRAGSGKSLWSNKENTAQEEMDGLASSMIGPDDTLAAWKRKSNNSSPIIGSSEDNLPTLDMANQSLGSPPSTPDDYVSRIAREDGILESVTGGPEVADPLPKVGQLAAQQEEDAGITKGDMRNLSADDDQYEIFDLTIIHRKNRTGFEEDKDFQVTCNSVIAGRYHVTEYLGSAAFSKAIQAHDLHTGVDVCMKIIKNNKDFFDQSLDEIKLLKFVNKHDPADKYHLLRLYDYFYHREHVFIVCELLRANLYEFQKFNRESGGEVYFTMARLQCITVQCLEALEFLHRLGIIHCDLKPENILVKSYSRCEIKIIDLGSSCFQTDQLCSYVQSRSYRAPEVILGLPYDQKIDIWSLGCILAELCTGNVLFQNDSLATLLARVVGILGPIDPEVLAKGHDTYKYFTKNHMLYERNQETDQLEYLLPKKTSLSHRLPMGDEGFVEFVGFLLQHNPVKRPTASEALRHPWLSYPYEPISS